MNETKSVLVETRTGPGCLIQIIWFAFIGIWLGQAWMIAAWLLMVTVVGIPLGIAMLNKIPKVIALREPTRPILITRRGDGALTRQEAPRPQVHIVLRALYFLLIGWWASALWMEAAYALCLTIIGLPLGFWMFDRVPLIVSLQQ